MSVSHKLRWRAVLHTRGIVATGLFGLAQATWRGCPGQLRGIERNGAKIKSVQINAQFLLDLKPEHGSAARFFADWPDKDYIGLLDILKKRANHLGGDAAGRFLRAIGKPAFIASPDMVAALIRATRLTFAPRSLHDMRPDIARTRPQQAAGGNLLDGMRHPADTAADGEQRKRTTLRKAAMLHQRGQRDIDGRAQASQAIRAFDQRTRARRRLERPQ